MDPRYKTLELVREGRAIRVFKARDTQLERDITVRRYVKDTGAKMESEDTDKFLDFTEKLCQVQHPSLATIYDVGIDEDGAFVITDNPKGKLIFDIVNENGPLSEYKTYLMARDLIDALQTVHHYDFIHGAFSLRSIAMNDKASGLPEFNLLDLGLYSFAKLVENKTGESSKLTHHYLMAPELFSGEEPSESSDLYALGHLLYIALSGGHPFAGMSKEESMLAHKEGKIKPLSRYADVSESFEHWIHSLMQADPKSRPASAAVAAEMFREFSVQAPLSTKPLKPVPVETAAVPNYYASSVSKPPSKTTEILTYKTQPITQTLISQPTQFAEPRALITQAVSTKATGASRLNTINSQSPVTAVHQQQSAARPGVTTTPTVTGLPQSAATAVNYLDPQPVILQSAKGGGKVLLFTLLSIVLICIVVGIIFATRG